MKDNSVHVLNEMFQFCQEGRGMGTAEIEDQNIHLPLYPLHCMALT